ncbi:diiron oxygenase [Phenylobacterium sp. J426]|uniref:diiron oxygenase n=1 Tax=Phenylobacterium sp. J426 TaxID=2898439 RepID=UPI0021518918|nr:diiron oxygenase [Phenylobacterium sp. J426]MCR5875770.1 diiron oxygenase [Phenylobacterium sp. J426]
MIQGHSYERLLEISKRVNWRIEDIIGPDKPMDFARHFLPETFARTGELDFLSPDERLKLNQIRGFGYLAMFELVERCILPAIEQHVPSRPGQDPHRTAALQNFADEEAKHIELFVRFRKAFTDGFDVACAVIGPAEDIGAMIRSHGKLGVALFVLAIEWATQQHWLESVQDDEGLDPQFKSLLKHHWMEESQHAKLDALVFYELAEKAGPEGVMQAVQEFLQIGAFLDGGLAQQVAFDLDAFERATGRSLTQDQRAAFTARQHQAQRWTFLGSALVNQGFLKALGEVSPAGRARLEEVAPAFC